MPALPVYRQVFFRPLARQLPEQHWLANVQFAPPARHVQAGSVAHEGSAQSTRPSQFSSRPPVHSSTAPGWMLASASLQSVWAQ